MTDRPMQHLSMAEVQAELVARFPKGFVLAWIEEDSERTCMHGNHTTRLGLAELLKMAAARNMNMRRDGT